MRLKRWVGTGVVALLLLGAAGARAAETVPVYETADECREKHQLPCFQVENGWSPGEYDDISNTPGEKVVEDEENLRRQGMAMRVNTDGTLDHPIVAVDMNQVQFPDVQPQERHRPYVLTNSQLNLMLCFPRSLLLRARL